MRYRVRALLATLISFAATATVVAQARTKATPAAAGPAIDSVVARAMAEWELPGVAVGVVKDGQVIHQKGYGYRDVEKRLPVTHRTLMAIGSNSKSFTAVLMGMLADQKKLDWDKPVRSYLADFQLYDDYATRNLTPRDLVTHRSGLPRHDRLWLGRKFTPRELYDRLRYLEPSTSFRDKWQYNNLMFMTAGYLIEQRSGGRPWAELVKTQIFEPLGMTRSLPGYPGFRESDDFAEPYEVRNGSLVKVPVRNIDHVGAAGSIYSSVEDMLKYIQFRLSHGAGFGRAKVSKAFEDQAQSPQMAQQGSPGLGFELVGYGLGVRVASYRGQKVVGHGGGIDGFISQMSWLPDKKVGVIVLTNRGWLNPAPPVLIHSVYDRVLGLERIDWIGKQRELDRENERKADSSRRAFLAGRVQGTKPSHPITAYAGTYRHPGYGEVVIRQTGEGELEAVLDEIVWPLTHYHYDMFEMGSPTSGPPGTELATFLTNPKGEIDQMTVPLESTLPPIVFSKK